MKNTSPYLKNNRLADVLALIQVLALDQYAHRAVSGLKIELQGDPRSAACWSEIATDHPEFFRYKTDANYGISLVSRHVTPKDEASRKNLTTEFIQTLIQTAIQIHDTEHKNADFFTRCGPSIAAIAAAIIALGGVLLQLLLK